MTWSQQFRDALELVEHEQAQKVRRAGYTLEYVTEEEHENGVGATVGINAIRDGVWYTLRQALSGIGERTDFHALAVERGYLEK